MPYTKVLYAYWKEMSLHSGFEIFEEADFCALKSPCKMPWGHFVWGEIDTESIRKVADFYKELPYAWIVRADQERHSAYLNEAGLKFVGTFPEMTLDLKAWQLEEPTSEITIEEVETNQAFDQWVDISAENFALSNEEFRKFVYPCFEKRNDSKGFVLGLHEGIPVAAAQYYASGGYVGVFCVSVKGPFRKKGLGKAVSAACIEKGKGSKMASLLSSHMAESLYRKMGFKEAQHFSIWVAPSAFIKK